MTQEELFRYGYGEYRTAIRHMETLHQFLSQTKTETTLENAKRDFDIVLQGLMLKVAIADDDASAEEIDYIKSIVDTGDILQFLSDFTNGEVDLSWRLLTLLDNDTFKKLVAVLDEPLQGIIKKFALPYALMEVIIEKNYFDTFKDSILGIMAPLCMIDGDSDNMSEKFSVALAMRMFENGWNEVKEMARQEQHKNAPSAAPMGNTLKSRFEHLKKN